MQYHLLVLCKATEKLCTDGVTLNVGMCLTSMPMQDSALAEQHCRACAAVAAGVTLCAAPPASRPAGLLHDVFAHYLQVALMGMVAHADLQT